jgi:hypothetical protein
VTQEDKTLELAAQVAEVIARHGHASAVIGAVAGAIHGYPRSTEDLDLAVNVDPFETFEPVCDELRSHGLDVEYEVPDRDDPLGGVVTVRAEGAMPVQIVNFYNPLRARNTLVGRRAIDTADAQVLGALSVVRLPHLIALKLYAGGPKSTLDILELLARNPELDMDELRALCRELRLERELDAVLARLTE